MKRLKVIIAPVVQRQIEAQVLYIAKDSIDNALAWEDRLRIAIENIGTVPGHAIDEVATLRLGYPIRKSVFERTYLIHYRVDDLKQVVEIVNFRHGTRLPEKGEP